MLRFSKRFTAGIGGLALAVGAFGAPLPFDVAPVHAAGVVQLTFLNINDFHGRITGETGSAPNSPTVQFAGTIEKARIDAGGDDNTLLLSAGDNIGASLYASSSAKDQPTIDVLNALELDASAIGNHELDKGFADLTGRVIGGNGPNAAATWDYLGANVYNAGTETLAIPGSDYELFEVGPVGNTVTVAVIGAVTQETPSLVSPSGVSMLSFGDPVDAVNRVAAVLSDGVDNPGTNDEADVIIAEYHEGAPDAQPSGKPSILADEIAKGGVFAKIATQTSAAVDVIFSGHTHKQYAWDGDIPGQPGKTRPIVQTGSYGEFLGKVVLSFDTDTNVVTAAVGSNIPRETRTDAVLVGLYPRAAAVRNIVNTAAAAAAITGNVAIGSVTKDITTAYLGGSSATGTYVGGTRDDRSKESALGNLVANSLVSSLSPVERGGATIGVVNPGGLRDELLRAPDTVVTVAEATAVLPFANNLNTVSLTGAQFKTLLEQQWQRDAAGAIPSRAYLQLGLSDNVSYTFDPALAEGSRITSITIDGKPYDPAASYRIGTFSFLTDGGDNFRIFTQGTNKKDSGLIDADAWIQYVKDKSPLSPSFARHSALVTPLPTTAIVGSKLNFTVSSLDLTSLGSPANTSLKVTVGGVDAGSVPVAAGSATVNVTVPAAATGGAQSIVLTAVPSGTTVTLPVTVVRTFAPVSPKRLFDTRPGQSPDALRVVPKSTIGGANVLEVKVIDLPGLVPATGVASVSLNVTATNAAGPGYLTVYPCGDRKNVSSVNYVAGVDSANAVSVPVSPTGTVCFYSLVAADVVVDVNGWYATGSGFNAVTPNRVFDTRINESPDAIVTVAKATVGGSNVLEVKVTGIAGLVPATGVSAVSLNVTAIDAGFDGYVTVYPCGDLKTVSSVNFTAGKTTANGVLTPISPTGTVCFYASTPVDLAVDINAWFATGTGFTPVAPDRVFDTRVGESPKALRSVAKTKVGGTYVLEVKVTGLTGLVPATGVGAVSLNVAAVNAAAAGYVTVYPCGDRALVSSLNFVPGQTVANSVITPVSADGTVCFYSLAPIDLLADVNGWFAA